MRAHQPLFAPAIKRLVDTVDRGPADDVFYPADSNTTVFRRTWNPYHNATPEVVEIGYKGNAAWGGRIMIPLDKKECGDLVSWVAIRLQPRSWLGPDLESKLGSGEWDYADPSGAWMWAASLGTIAVASVELQINEVTVEQWPGEWMDVWSRMMMDAGRAPTWDADIYGQAPSWVMHDTTRPPWTTFRPTEDGYVYCWLPLCFFRRPRTAFPLLALGAQTEMRVIVNFRPFSEVVRRRAIPRTGPFEVPLGQEIWLVDKTGETPIPKGPFPLLDTVPDFEDVTVLAGVVHLEDPLREAYMRVPMEMIYDPVTYMRFDTTNSVTREYAPSGPEVNTTGCPPPVLQTLRLSGLNGPIREVVWFLRRKDVWQYNEWTNYGARMENALIRTLPLQTLANLSMSNPTTLPKQAPLLKRATLYGGNAIWRDELEQWWRADWGMSHRGGVRVAGGMVYGFQFGWATDWKPVDLQPAMTFNASRADLKLELLVNVPPTGAESCASGDENAWDVHVFAVGVNWLRFVEGQAVPLFKD